MVCSWSCRNLLAFSTDMKGEDEDKEVSHMIHIIDTEHPWDVYSINSGHTEVISCLEWDQSDGDGQIKCWAMSDHLVNSWECLHCSSLDGDPIVALSWLHNGVKLALHVEMFSPSLTLFGGKPMEGWLAVTVSGLVSVSLLKPGGALLTASESLCRLRGRVALADIAFTGGGNIVVVVSVVSEKCRIDTELLPSLFLRCTTDPLRREKAAASLSVVGEKQPTILKWRILTTTSDLERVSSIALPKLPISISNTDLKVASDTKFCPGLGLALAFHDGSIQILHRLSPHYGRFLRCTCCASRPRWVRFWRDEHDAAPPSVPAGVLHGDGVRLVDVLLHVQPGMVHNLVEKLHEEYMRQNQALQQVLATRIVAVKASLCKLSAAGGSSLHLQSLLRPHVLNTPDKSPGDRLTEICAKNIDTVPAAAHPMVGDFVALPAGQPAQPDLGSAEARLPAPFTATSDNQDSMQLLFRLLTRLRPPQDPDESLIDECCLLPSQLLVPGMDWLPLNDGVMVKLQGKTPLRLQSPSSQKMDHLRCVHMGVCPTEESKACTRCGCVTMLRSPNKTSAMKQWEQRWIKNCLCGGLWRRIPPMLT
ncbi:hypothetical protein F7725_027205 [Dissostichus mawsoni]|uniref:Mediator of RNA polymerase II transcription subunit 16 n=1 Tax=Dissostichus mawsoni TaxID=36200 RepID=A0A7J5XDI4_DISMA|nr:hypothetical protein F7725_027205 [Dissostichus mawsoni]